MVRSPYNIEVFQMHRRTQSPNVAVIALVYSLKSSITPKRGFCKFAYGEFASSCRSAEETHV